ncbi:MAG TPA: hypothetical protein VME43_19295 [Bryobacteraceae bacterium]|nr:hypothetical protein [Bryobacteraceae bacterium]
MKAALLLLALSLCLSAQSVGAAPGLNSDLQSLRAGARPTPAFTRQVVAHILLLAERTHEPQAPTLQQFSESLVAALSGHSPAREDIDRLAGDIEEVLQSAGTSTAGFEQTIQDFEKHLMHAGVPAVRSRLVASNLEHIGREVRGPEGVPVK